MSTFSNIPGIDPAQYSIEVVAKAAWQALQILEGRKSHNWTPIRSQPTVWQVDRAKTWKIYMFPKRFQLFSYYGEEDLANKIVEMIPKLSISTTVLKSRNSNSHTFSIIDNSIVDRSNLSQAEKDACFKVAARQTDRILKNTSNFTELAKNGGITISPEHEKKN